MFGSGLAIVPFLHGGVVKEYGWLNDQEFLDAVNPLEGRIHAPVKIDFSQNRLEKRLRLGEDVTSISPLAFIVSSNASSLSGETHAFNTIAERS